MRRRWILPVFLVVSFLFFLSGCQSKEAGPGGKSVVYASFYPIQEMTGNLAGDTLDVRSFVPVNADPHMWEPTPRDMQKLSQADMLVVNGANMEHWLDRVRESLPNLKIINLADGIELITYKGAAALGDFQYMGKIAAKAGQTYKIDFGHTHEDIMRVCFQKYDPQKSLSSQIDRAKKTMESKGQLVPQHSKIGVEEGRVYSLEMGHESGEISYELPEDGEWLFVSDRQSEAILPYTLTDEALQALPVETLLQGSTSGMDKITYDPHSWLSLRNAKKYYNEILTALCETYPENEAFYKKNKLKYVDQLTDLDAEYREKFAGLGHRDFLVTHHAFAYLARDYNLVQYPLQGLTTTESPSLKTIRKAMDFCQDKGIRTVFYEAGLEPKGADTLAEDLHGQAVPLVSLEHGTVRRDGKELTYVEVMRDNLAKIYQSMEGGGSP